MAELVRAGACGHGPLADEGAVGRAHALRDAHHNGVLPAQKARDALHQGVLVKRRLGEKNQVGSFRATRSREGGGPGEPAGVAPHDLDEGHALEVVDVRVAEELAAGGGHELCRAAVAGRVVGAHEVVVDGLGYADEADRAAYLAAVGAQLGDGVHGVVAADVEHGVDPVGVQARKDVLVERGVGEVGQLEAAASQPACRRLPQQRQALLVRKRGPQVDGPAGEKPLDAVAHARDLAALLARRRDDARQARVDCRRGTAGLTDQDVLLA